MVDSKPPAPWPDNRPRIDPEVSGSQRRITPAHTIPVPPSAPAESALVESLLTQVAPQHYTSDDVATGRSFHYEWEDMMIDVLNRIGDIELGGMHGVTFVQVAPAATWSITHDLSTFPGVTIVSDIGDLLYAEVTYPDDANCVLIFGSPYSGTAYLRG